jgi:hypothetical protein
MPWSARISRTRLPELPEKLAFVRQTAVLVAQRRPDGTVQTRFGMGQTFAACHARSFRPAMIAKQNDRRIDRDQMALPDALM